MKLDNLFATPIWTETFDDHQTLNSKLMQEGVAPKPGQNYFNIPSPAIQDLKNRVTSRFESIIQECNFENKNLVLRSRQNVVEPFVSDTPHYHYGTLVGVYYVSTPENCGDMLLHDPRGSIYWENLNFVPDDPFATKRTRTYHRIRPQSGLLVIFPSFLTHSVETNLSNQKRISIVFQAQLYKNV